MTLAVAPMEGITIFPTRLWLHMASRPEAMTTPFLRVNQAHPEPGRGLPDTFAPELFALRGALPYELVPQLMASDPEHFLRAAAWLPPEVAAAIELNCGCPSPTSAGRYAGSRVLREPDVFGRTIELLAGELGAARLAIKMRLGYDEVDEFPGLLRHVASLPLARLTVHGRTRADGYRGAARWDRIQEAALAARAPTWASGDVTGRGTWDRLWQEAPAVSGVMIGRGVLRNPWVFDEVRTGTLVRIDVVTLVNALLSFAVLQELWIRAPEKLIGRVAQGRLGEVCGTDFGKWERVTAGLTGLAFGAPFIVTSGRDVPEIPVSPTVVDRVRYLWSHLRTSLPPAFQGARLLRTRRLDELFSLVFAAASEPSYSLFSEGPGP